MATRTPTSIHPSNRPPGTLYTNPSAFHEMAQVGDWRVTNLGPIELFDIDQLSNGDQRLWLRYADDHSATWFTVRQA